MSLEPSEILEYVEVALSVVGFLSVVAAVTPTPIDNMVLVALKKILNILAMNFGGAENAALPGDADSVKDAKKARERRIRQRKVKGSRKP